RRPARSGRRCSRPVDSSSWASSACASSARRAGGPPSPPGRRSTPSRASNPSPAMRPRPEILAALSRRILAVFFRSFEVAGAERIPRDRPLLLVANHVNGLIDPLLILGPLPVLPRFLGKNTLWKIPLLRPFLALAGVIPVVRQQDAAPGTSDSGTRRSANDEAFAQAYEILAAGGAIALFPEGKSHTEPSLQPLKSDAARILLEAERRNPDL